MEDKIGFHGELPTQEALEERAKQLDVWEAQHPYVGDMSLEELKEYIKSIIMSLSSEEKTKFIEGLVSFIK